MNTKKRRISASERRERRRRMMSLTHVLIAIVALAECLLLVSFTTYSWIESSSALIISSGKEGGIAMSIADTLNYKVALGFDSGGNVRLDRVVNADNETTEHGFYRTVKDFSYAMTSSQDGKTFYFPKTTKENGVYKPVANSYRLGDTADYNTAYTYIDFTLTNSTLSNKSFFFADENIFSVTGADQETENIIKSAMRISVEKKNTASGATVGPLIFSLNGDKMGESTPDTTNAVINVDGDADDVDTKAIKDSVFSKTEEKDPIFESDYNTEENRDANDNVVDQISIRIWFESKDPNYLRATTGDHAGEKTNVDNAIFAAKVSVSFKMLFDNVDYDQIYFDDYTFSNKIFEDQETQKRIEKHTTEESDANRMYLHVFNSDENRYVNYPMSKTESPEGALRWVTMVPVNYVVNTYLTNDESDQFGNAYFFYAPSASTEFRTDPTSIIYKWPLQAAMTLGGSGDENDPLYIASGDTTRAIGLVRDATNTSASSTVTGYSMADDASDPMTLVYLRDRTTGLTGSGYNMNTSSVRGAGYINSSVSTITDPIPRIVYRFQIPESADYMYFNKGAAGNVSQSKTLSKNEIVDGKCYYVGISVDVSDNYNQVVYDDADNSDKGSLPIELPKSTVEDEKTIYFYYYDTDGWRHEFDTPHVYYWTTSGDNNNPAGASAGVGKEMEVYTTIYLSSYVPNLYINNFSETLNNQSAKAQRSISMYYDNNNAQDPMFKAYVPASWLTSESTNMTFHFNRLGYYDDDHDTIAFGTGPGSQTNGAYIYSALGYTNAAARNLLVNGTGVGTWDDVRLMRFDTELIDSNIKSEYVYKIGFDTGSGYADYPMAPSEYTGLIFAAYMPVNASIRFTRYADYTTGTPNGYWYPQDPITAQDVVYYAVDPTAEWDNGAAATAVRGWFHVAVLVDATFENLIYDTVFGADAAQGASLSYSTGNSYTEISSGNLMNGGTDTFTRRWVVPCGVDDTVYFKWIPYTNTIFEYSIVTSTMDETKPNIYCVVTEAPAAVQAEAAQEEETEPEP